MKKIASMVGVGAMVISLGLSSAFAQQTTSPTVNTPPAASEKVKAPEAKPAIDMKNDKAGSVKPVVPGTEAKSGIEVKPQASAPAKATTEMKSEVTAPAKTATDKVATVKPADDKTGKITDIKAADEKKDPKAEPAKTSTADTGKKFDETKSVK